MDSLRSNDSDDEGDDDTSPSGQEKDYGAEAVLRWAEVREYYTFSFVMSWLILEIFKWSTHPVARF